jgi:hypothetical protein
MGSPTSGHSLLRLAVILRRARDITPRELKAKEDAILDRLEHAPGDSTFRNRLYRDGVPTPNRISHNQFKPFLCFASRACLLAPGRRTCVTPSAIRASDQKLWVMPEESI